MKVQRETMKVPSSVKLLVLISLLLMFLSCSRGLEEPNVEIIKTKSSDKAISDNALDMYKSLYGKNLRNSSVEAKDISYMPFSKLRNGVSYFLHMTHVYPR